MKNYMMITPQSLINMSKCFSDTEEVALFMSHLHELAQELSFQQEMSKRIKSDENAVSHVIMSQICTISIFFREHIELIHDLISKMEVTPFSEEEVKG